MAEPARQLEQIGPQLGKQVDFLSTPADIAIYGGARGGGKSFALLLEPLRHIGVKGFGAVIFRRTSVQVRSEGGLWAEAWKIYPRLGARPHEAALEWVFPSGAHVRFAHLEHEQNKLDWHGAQICLLCFDELTTFTESQFWYLTASNRSTCGVRPYLRATCNPEADSWVANLIAWWIDGDGYPREERSGVLRWLLRAGDEMAQFDSRDEALAARASLGLSDDVEPMSLTFIPAKLTDNRALMSRDPAYKARLEALPRVERLRFLAGNWKIRPSAGNFFRAEWFEIVDAYPQNSRGCRYWDLAATKAEAGTDPDWTAGARIHVDNSGVVYVADIRRHRGNPPDVEKLVLWTAHNDGKVLPVWIEEEGGASGKSLVSYYARQVLPGFNVRGHRPTGDKTLYAGSLSAQAEAGNVKLVRGEWNRAFIDQAEAFPDGTHDDFIDAAAKAYDRMVKNVRWGVA